MFGVIFILVLETIGILLMMSIMLFKHDPSGDLGGLWLIIFFFLGIIITVISTIWGLIAGIRGNKKFPELKRHKILFRISYIVLILSMIFFSIIILTPL